MDEEDEHMEVIDDLGEGSSEHSNNSGDEEFSEDGDGSVSGSLSSSGSSKSASGVHLYKDKNYPSIKQTQK